MKIRIKSGECPSYLTVGKSYKAFLWIGHKLLLPEVAITVSLNDCGHLNGGSWEIVDE